MMVVRTTLKKYSNIGSNRLFLFILLISLLYLVTMYRLTSHNNGECSTAKLSTDQHGSDSHADLQVTNEIIIILGYKLHPDGMATRVLRDRVEKAASLYKTLMDNNHHHPLVIVSGKGKEEIGYTEAEIMKEWSMIFGIREQDIMVDMKSANTAQNAMFSAELIHDHVVINHVYVVSSDYHIPRSQYIFQSVFPTNITLDFAASRTNPSKLDDMLKRERILMKSSQADLVAEKLIDSNDESGYHPIRNFPRWQMIERELENDIRDNIVDPQDSTINVVDYGSNFGYFSMNLAKKFNKGVVISLEGESDAEYKGSHKVHEEKLKNASITNNIVCKTTVRPSTFRELKYAKQVFTYQLCLSVFHWFTPMYNSNDFEKTLGLLLLSARTTFLELPEAIKYSARDQQHNWEMINLWYQGRNETQILKDVATRMGVVFDIKVLGPILHENETVRKVIRVDVVGNNPHSDLSESISVFKCESTYGGSLSPPPSMTLNAT